MNEIKIKVSIKVWIYCILMLVALYAILLGVSYHFNGTSNHWISTVTMIAVMLAFNLIPRRFIQNTRLVITDDTLTVNSLETWVVQLSGVDSFYTDKYKGRKIIGIRYKDNIADGITDAEIAKGRKERRKSQLTGYPYCLTANLFRNHDKQFRVRENYQCRVPDSTPGWCLYP